VSPRAVWLIAKGVLIEAVRRREIYAIVLISLVLIGAVMTVRFFDIEGLSKFYREVALRVMGIATALLVIVLSARQLPREFEKRTIYPLMARPISRTAFLLGKLLGVMLSAAFCFVLFMIVYAVGSILIGAAIPWALFAQHIYLQLLMLAILATLAFWLSLLLNLDAAITIGALFYFLAATFTSITTYIYDYADAFGQWVIRVMTYVIPQLPVFDLSGRTVHAERWEPVPLGMMLLVTGYGLLFIALYFALATLLFRRRAL